MTRRAVSWRLVGVLGLALGLWCLSACGPGDTAVPLRLEVRDAWARATPAVATRGVVYLELTTDRADAVVSAAVDPLVASSASLHETMGAHGAAHHGGGDGGQVTMVATDSLEVTPGEVLVFEPGGNHVMLEGLVAPLVDGDRFELRLGFESGRTLDVEVVVSENGPAASGGGGGH